jgi:hypothetical protein
MPLYRWQAGVFHTMRALVGGAIVEAERLARNAFQIGQHAQTSDVVALTFGAEDFYIRWLEGRLEELEPAMKAFAGQNPWMQAWSAGLAFLYSEIGRRAEAAAQMAKLGDDDFMDLTRDAGWLTSL